MLIVDSSVWIDFFNNKPSLHVAALAGSLVELEIGIGDLILYEVLQGIRAQSEYQRVRWALLQFPIHTIGGSPIAVKGAENCRLLRRRGITIRKTIDCLIATFVIENGHTLLHNDRDFDPFEQHLGLRVVQV